MASEFTYSGSYLGISGHTDDQGQVSFDLSDGDNKFRADYLGYQFWTDVSTIPTTLSDTLTIPHQDVTITVNEVYGYDTTPLENIPVYLFTSSGSYMGVYENTDDQGQATFNLPQEDYKVKADYLSGQYFSDVFNWIDTDVDIDHGLVDLHVTFNEEDLFDAPVYLFTESGSYLGRYERTDEYGHAEFLIPAKSYKFRVDYEGTQYWSGLVTIIPHEENNIELNLDQLALNLTNDPNPVRFDGKPPVFKGEEIRVASIGTLTGILFQTVVANTSSPKVYYYLNDHLDTPQIILDEDGEIIWKAEYKPFGDANVDPASLATNNFRFPGQYYDGETGLHYNYHRYYDPSSGRYLTQDPIGLAGMDPNLYGYVLNNPINSIDPLGLRTLYETFYGPFIDEFQRYNPVEHYLFKQYASDIDVDDWPCETEGWMKHYASAWKDFDPYARDNAMSVLGQAFSDFVKEQYGPLSWIGTYLNNLWGVISGGISGAGTLKSITGMPKTSQEVLDLTLYGPKVINKKTFTEAFGSGYDLFFL